MKDCEIIALYNERDEQAISQTASKYGDYCYSVAFGILQQDEDAKECVNDTYLRVWSAIPPHCPSNMRTFLGKITRNVAFDRYRKHKADKRNNGEVSLTLEELLECIPSNDDLDVMVEKHIIADVYNTFLRLLPKKERIIFLRRYWYNDSVKDIAFSFGMKENHVSVLLYRLRTKLKDLLEREGISRDR